MAEGNDGDDMKVIHYKDTELLSRLPVGVWFAAGAYSLNGSRLARLVRLGLLIRRYAPFGWGRKWEYLRPR